MIRIAAAADLHFGTDSAGILRPALEEAAEQADLMLLGGDLTRRGEPEEAGVLAEEVRDIPIPIIAVLGNHDYHVDREKEVADVLRNAGMHVLEGTAEVIPVNGARVAVAGVKGFGGGFPGASGSEFGEPEMKAFIRHSRAIADTLERALEETAADVRVALMHYSPIRETLIGEPPELYPFLGSYLLAEAVDRAGADLILHGHAHRGVEKGMTAGGVHVRNVAQPVLNRAYGLFSFDEHGLARPQERADERRLRTSHTDVSHREGGDR